MKRIKVLVVEPQKAPYVKEISDTSDTKRKIVSLWTTKITAPKENVAFLQKNKGKLHSLPFNRTLYNMEGQPIDILCGSFYLCLKSSDSDEYFSLPDDLIEKYKSVFSLEHGNRVYANR